jgi:hypothetical protein
MQQKLEKVIQNVAAIHPKHKIVPFDQASSSISPMIHATKILGFSTFFFNFFNEGGTNNLLPGRPTTQQLSFDNPTEASVFACLSMFNGSFVTDGGVHLTERPLGEFEVGLSFPNLTTLSCRIRLTDSNSDDPVTIQVAGILVFVQ